MPVLRLPSDVGDTEEWSSLEAKESSALLMFCLLHVFCWNKSPLIGLQGRKLGLIPGIFCTPGSMLECNTNLMTRSHELIDLLTTWAAVGRKLHSQLSSSR